MAGSYGEAFANAFIAGRQQQSQEQNDEVTNTIKMDEHRAKQLSASQEAAIQSAFQDIAKKEGIGPALDYYQMVKPKEASDIMKVIEDTKKSIAETLKTNADAALVDVNSKQALNNLTTAAMDTIGGFGQQLMNVPEGDQEEVFKQMLPKLKQLDSNFPTDMGKAKTYFQGAAALSVPASKIWQSEKDDARAQTEIVKNIDFLNKNPNLPPEQKDALNAKINEAATSQAMARAEKARAMGKETMDQGTVLRKELTAATETYQKGSAAALRVKNLINTKGEFANFSALADFIKISYPNAKYNPDGTVALSEMGGVPENVANLYNQFKEGKAQLSDKDRVEIMDSINASQRVNSSVYEQTRSFYNNIGREQGIPAHLYDQDLENSMKAADQSSFLRQVPPELQEATKNAIEQFGLEKTQKHFEENLKGGK